MTTTPPPGDPQGRYDLPDGTPSEELPLLTAPAPPPGVLDAARAAAMAAFDEQHASETAPGVPVGDLAAARSRRWYQRMPLGAAAAVIAAIAIVGALTQIDTGDDDDLATAVADDSAELDTAGELGAGDDGAGALESPEAALEADSSFSDDARVEEGAASLDATASYDDLDAFLAVLARRDPTATASTPPQPSTTNAQPDGGSGGDSDDGDEPPCDAIAIAGVDGVVAVEVAFVEDLGVSVAAVVYESASGARVTSVDLASCAVLDDRAL